MSELKRWTTKRRFLAGSSLCVIAILVLISLQCAKSTPDKSVQRESERISEVTPAARPDSGNIPTPPTTTQAANVQVMPTSFSAKALEKIPAVPKFKKEGPNDALRISLDDIDLERHFKKEVTIQERVQSLPKWLSKLNGLRIRIRGYMHPGSAFQETGISQFHLVRHTIYFGPTQPIDQIVGVTLREGTSTDFIDRLAFDVEGFIRIWPEVDAKRDEVVGLYYIDDAQIVPRQ